MPPSAALEPIFRQPIWLAFAFAFGALFGSFANVCIARLPRGMSIVRPPSHCFACQTPVRWFDNLPIVSYLVLRGRCRKCGAGYSPRYLFVELATGLLFAGVWVLTIFLLWPDDPIETRLARFCIYAMFVFVLVVITFIDIDHKLILDVVTFPAVGFFLGAALLLGDRPWWDHALGVVLGYGVVRGISDLYYFLTKREGLGYGDGKLLAVVGALLGWPAVLFALFGGAMLGSVIGVTILLVTRPRPGAAPAGEPPPEGQEGPAGAESDDPPLRHTEIPFGPYLIAATLVYLFLQERLSVELGLLLSPLA